MINQDKMRLRELLMAFLVGMSQYPTDADRAERAMKIIEQFIDDISDKSVLAAQAKNIKMHVS